MPEETIVAQAAQEVFKEKPVNEEPSESSEQKPDAGEETPEPKTEIKPVKTEEEIEYGRNVQKRIDKLTREKNEERRLRLAAEEQLKNPVQPFRPIRPSIKDFTDEYGTLNHVVYDAAMVKYEDTLLTHREREKQETERKQRLIQEEREKQQDFDEKCESLIEKYPDYVQVASQKIFDLPLRNALLDSDKGPEITYILGKNLEETQRLNQLGLTNPLKMMKEIARLEDKVTQELAKITTKAPAPITPVEDSKGMVKDESKPKDDDAWYQRYKQEQIRKKFKDKGK